MSTSTETFQHYQVLKNPDGSLCELGRGAMGVTYKAFDTSLRCNVALKVINTTYLGSETAGQRFLREARAAAGLSHPNVASVFHLGQADGNYFYAMEYIDGETLESFVKRRGPLPPLTALKITLQVARALRAAARLGLVHRDIKPANLMLVREDDEEGADGDDLHVKVIDFGLAKVMRSDGLDASGTITVAGFVGTPHFASPEQLEEKDLDARSDIYSLGVTLWYMLAGRPPFSGSMVQVMSQHLTQRPPFERLPGVPPAVRRVLERMLEKDSAGRPQSPTDLRREIEQAIAALAGSPADVIPPVGGEQDAPGGPGAPHPGPAPVGRSAPGSLLPGTILGDRYQLMRQISRSERGALFQATELDTLSTVAVRVLAPEMVPDAVAYEQIRLRFNGAQGIPHPALLRLFALQQAGDHTFLAYEWVNGFPLLDVLRQRPVLSFDEVVRVLQPLAVAVDALKDAGGGSTELESDKVLLSYEAAADPDTRTALLSSTLVEWPACQPKILPLRLASETGSSATWTGQQTMVPSGNVNPSGTTQLASLAYELLGGNLSHLQATKRYSPLPTIGESGNDLLREHLFAGGNAGDRRAGEFVDALLATTRSGGGGQNAPSPRRHTSAPVIPPPVPEASTSETAHVLLTDVPPPVLPSALRPPPLPPGHAKTGRFAPILLVSSILLLAVGALGYFALKAGKTLPRPVTGNDRHIPEVQPTVEPTPPATPAPIVDAQPATPAASTPFPSPSLPEPTPAPSEPDRLAAALEKAHALQDNRQTAAAFAAYVRIAEEFPASDEGLGRVDSYISAMQADPLGAEAEQQRFQQFRASLERAAGIGSDLAMLFLADHLRSTEPKAAADWYHRAVEKGRPEAMMALGDMYFSGTGVSLDPSQTSHWYQMASDKGYVKAKVKLAECYERGIGGVERNFDRAFRLLNEALGLEPNDARALEKLGLDYEAGHGTAPDAKRAFTLMKRASDLGNINATSVLGAYYMKGLGTPRDEKQGVTLFKQGADKDNATAMFYYAQCLRAGLGGLTANKAEAASYYRASAERGFGPAKSYCQENHLHFGP